MGVTHHDARWPPVRLAAKRRDGFKCQECGSNYRLEVHHVIPVGQEPAKAFDVGNCVTLCRSCHITKTLAERGQAPSPARIAWVSLLKQGNLNA